jgi:hypothetical protein
LRQALPKFVTLPRLTEPHRFKLLASWATFPMLSSQNPPPSTDSCSTLISCKPISGLKVLVPF